MLSTHLFCVDNARFPQNFEMVGQGGFGNVVAAAGAAGLLTFLGNGFNNIQSDGVP